MIYFGKKGFYRIFSFRPYYFELLVFAFEDFDFDVELDFEEADFDFDETELVDTGAEVEGSIDGVETDGLAQGRVASEI